MWLKISVEKSWTMMMKAANPAWQLHVQRAELAWTDSRKDLCEWVDKRLSFTDHAVNLSKKTQARLNVIQAMT